MFFTFIGGTYRRQTSTDSLPLYEADPIYGNTASVSSAATFAAGGETVHHPVASRMNSLPRIMPTHRRKILGRGNLLKSIPSCNLTIYFQEYNRSSSSLEGGCCGFDKKKDAVFIDCVYKIVIYFVKTPCLIKEE